MGTILLPLLRRGDWEFGHLAGVSCFPLSETLSENFIDWFGQAQDPGFFSRIIVILMGVPLVEGVFCGRGSREHFMWR